MIAALRRRNARRTAARADAAQDELIGQILTEQRRPILPNVWDEMGGELLGIRTKRIRSVVASVHGAALAAPLRGVR